MSVSPVRPFGLVSGSSSCGDGPDLGSAAGRPTPAELQKVSRQFEAIMVRQLLAPSIEPIMSGGSLGGASAGSSGGGVYGYMLTDVLADSVTQGGGLGLSSVIARQLSPSGSSGREADPS